MSEDEKPAKVRKGDAKRQRGNRTGFTTGACSAAAARAATLGLLLSEVPETVVCRLPNGQEQAFATSDGSVEESAGLAHAVIVKDAGDDPDATHGAHMTADVRILKHRAGEVVLKGGFGVGVVTKDGTEREVDVIVVATGFHVTDSPMFETIIGTQGRSLAQAWEHTGMQAYKGTFVHGFPNMLLMVGPSTGLGHTSIVYMIESQLNYLVSYFKQVRDQGITRTEVKADAQDEFNNSVQHGLRNSVWLTGGCASYYQDQNGNITTLWLANIDNLGIGNR